MKSVTKTLINILRIKLIKIIYINYLTLNLQIKNKLINNFINKYINKK